MLAETPDDYDFDLLLEHLESLLQMMAACHPHFLTWFAQMEKASVKCASWFVRVLGKTDLAQFFRGSE